jgi:biotin carboxyl carrier protein
MRFDVRVDGRHAVLEVERTGARCRFRYTGADEHFAVEVRDPRELASGVDAAGSTGTQSIAAPMPGKVIRILAEQGQQVEAGQGIVVVEAMKMQDELQAPKAGVLVAVRAAAGDAVTAGQVLAIIE